MMKDLPKEYSRYPRRSGSLQIQPKSVWVSLSADFGMEGYTSLDYRPSTILVWSLAAMASLQQIPAHFNFDISFLSWSNRAQAPIKLPRGKITCAARWYSLNNRRTELSRHFCRNHTVLRARQPCWIPRSEQRPHT